VNADEIEEIIRANIDKSVRVVYTDGIIQKLLVRTVDDEGFVCDIFTEISQPPRCTYWVRFSGVSGACPAGNEVAVGFSRHSD
jgi:hypothetical protein